MPPLLEWIMRAAKVFSIIEAARHQIGGGFINGIYRLYPICSQQQRPSTAKTRTTSLSSAIEEKGKRGKKKSYKANRELKSFISEETMLAIVHELSASNRMMAAALSEIARAKEIPPAPVEVTDFYVDGEEGDGQ